MCLVTSNKSRVPIACQSFNYISIFYALFDLHKPRFKLVRHLNAMPFASKVQVTLVGTATAILDINGVRFITDPVFDPVGTEYPVGEAVLKSTVGPAIEIENLPSIHAVLLSHEDHPDNLDQKGRQVLQNRLTFTTQDGEKNLGPS